MDRRKSLSKHEIDTILSCYHLKHSIAEISRKTQRSRSSVRNLLKSTGSYVTTEAGKNKLGKDFPKKRTKVQELVGDIVEILSNDDAHSHSFTAMNDDIHSVLSNEICEISTDDIKAKFSVNPIKTGDSNIVYMDANEANNSTSLEHLERITNLQKPKSLLRFRFQTSKRAIKRLTEGAKRFRRNQINW